MKTAFGLLACVLCLISVSARAHDAVYAEDAYYSVSYTPPVVYHSPVVYQAPVSYYGPVYYLSSAAATVVSAATPRYCSSPSTVIHITGGRGTYTTSNCGYSGSTVVVIGSRYARQPGYRHSWIR